MKLAFYSLLKRSATVAVRIVSDLLPIQLDSEREVIAPAVPSFLLPLPCNAARIASEYLIKFDNERNISERYLYHLSNVQVSWQGVVFQNLRLFHPSVIPERTRSDFEGSFLLRQWWGRSKRALPNNEVIGLAHGPWAVGNYYHWLIDSLPRLLMLRRRYPNCLLLIPANLPDYATATIAMLGFERHVLLQQEEVVTVPRLVFADYVAFPGYQDPAIMRELRKIIWSAVGVDPLSITRPRRRVYVSRSQQRKRLLTNETVVEALLKQYGFETVYFESLTFVKQVQLLAETEILVGVHGAGLTNLLFMQAQTTVIELMSLAYCNPCYYHLASCLDLHYYCLPSVSLKSSTPANLNDCDLTADTNELAYLLTKLFPNS